MATTEVSLQDAAAQVLQEADKPLPTADLTKRIRERKLFEPKGEAETNLERYVAAVLQREARGKSRKQRFVEVSPGVFGLRAKIGAPEFTWAPIYREMAEALLGYEDRQGDLVSLLGEIKAMGLPTVGLTDKDESGSIALAGIDPFTFFASFNRSVTQMNRRKVISEIRQRFTLKEPAPQDFFGIPLANNMQSWFFPYQKEREEGDIPALWTLAKQAIQGGAVWCRIRGV